MGRPSLLTDELIADAERAYALGLPETEVASVIGVSERTWYSWKASGQKAAEALEEPLERRTVAELRELLQSLDSDPDKVKPKGRRKKPSKADLVAAFEERARPFLQFLHSLHKARPRAKRALVEKLEALALGGIQTTETKTVTKLLGMKEGENVVGIGDPVVVETSVTTKETLPHVLAIRIMLERRHPEEWGPRRAQDSKPPETAEDQAHKFHEAARAMFSSVPEGPEIPAEDELSDDEVDEVYDRLVAAGEIAP